MEDNFEKQIKASMDNPPEYPFEERLWQDMNARLDKAAGPPTLTRVLNTWLPLLLLLLMLIPTALATLFYFKHQSTMERLSRLEQLVHQPPRLIRDTVVQRHVVLIRDTIYQPVTVSTLPGKAAAAPRLWGAGYDSFFTTYDPPSFSSRYESFNRPAAGSFAPFTRSWYQHREIPPAKAVSPAEHQAGPAPAEPSSAWRERLDFLPVSENPELKIDRPIVLPWVQVASGKQKKKLDHYLLPLKPTRFSVSTTFGMFTLIDNNANDGRNFTSNLWGEIGYGNRLSLVIGIEHYLNAFKWKIEDGNPSEIAGLPILPPDDPADVLQQVYGAFHYAQIPFGVKYQLPSQNRLHPYLGFGLLSSKATNSNLRFGYLSQQGEYSLSRERVLPKTFELSAIWNIFGLQYDWTKHWSILLEGGAQFDIKRVTRNYERSNLLRLNAGLRYQF